MTFTNDILVEMLDAMGDDDSIAKAAWASTKTPAEIEEALKDRKAVEGLINYLMKHRHGTPFEHNAFTFHVHAPIFVWREWHRHRIGFSYNEESGRYSKLSPIFWIPARERKLVPVADYKAARPEFDAASDDEYTWFVNDLKAGYIEAYTRYEDRLSRNYAKEAARAGLPVGIYSHCWVTCNLRSVLAFLSLRVHDKEALFVSYPQAEIDQAARQVEALVAQRFPIAYAAFVKNRRVAP